MTVLPERELEHARAFLLGALGLAGPLLPAAAMAEQARNLGMIQIDSIRVSGLRNHEIAWLARGEAPLQDYYDLLYRDRAFVETHYPLFAVRRDWLPWFQQDFRKAVAGADRLAEMRPLMRRLRRHIRDHGPVSSADFESERVAGGFNTVKATTKALEYLYYLGELQIAGRTRHFHRVFDLTERVLPEGKAAPRLARRDLEAACVRSAAWVLKLGTAEQLARRAALHLGTWRGGGIAAARKAVKRAIEAGLLVEAPFAPTSQSRPLLVLAEDAGRPVPGFDDTIRLLAPLDNLLFSRERLRAFFGVDYKFEAYTPRHLRRFYFALPILYRDRVVGVIDAKKDGEIWRVVGLELRQPTNRAELRRATHRLAGIAGAARVACSDGLPRTWRSALDGPIESQPAPPASCQADPARR